VEVLLKFTDAPVTQTEVRLEKKRGDLIYNYRYHSEKGNVTGFGNPLLIFPNYKDYGYGVFLLGGPSLKYVKENIQNEKDPFLRSMMWGSLWDSVREGELDPREYVELVVRVLMHKPDREGGRNDQIGSTALTNVRASAIEDESTTALLLNRVGTAMNYYIDPTPAPTPVTVPPRSADGMQRVTFNGAPSLEERLEGLLLNRMQNAETLGQRITYYRAFLSVASSENARKVLRDILNLKFEIRDLKLKTKDKFDIVTKLLILNDPEAPGLLAELEKTETSDDAKRYAYAARAGIPTAENKAKYWNDFVNNKDISESWIEAAFGPWNSIRHAELTLPYLEQALKELPNHKRNRKIFFVNGWLGAFIGGQRSEEALSIVNKFLADNPGLDNDLRLKILENVDVIERAVQIRERGRPRPQ
jgi:aminopeptidase N